MFFSRDLAYFVSGIEETDCLLSCITVQEKQQPHIPLLNSFPLIKMTDDETLKDVISPDDKCLLVFKLISSSQQDSSCYHMVL